MNKFVDGAGAYAHLDIAGPGIDAGETAYLDKAMAPGFGARLLAETIVRLASKGQ